MASADLDWNSFKSGCAYSIQPIFYKPRAYVPCPQSFFFHHRQELAANHFKGMHATTYLLLKEELLHTVPVQYFSDKPTIWGIFKQTNFGVKAKKLVNVQSFQKYTVYKIYACLKICNIYAYKPVLSHRLDPTSFTAYINGRKVSPLTTQKVVLGVIGPGMHKSHGGGRI